MNYAKVSILKAPGEFDAPLTYKVPSGLFADCRIGRGVSVELRAKKTRGIVVEIDQTPVKLETRILEIEDFLPELILEPGVIALARRISDYYRCSLLRALKLFVPQVLWRGSGKRLLQQIEKADYRAASLDQFPITPYECELTARQAEALEFIEKADHPVLLQGITGSGKTEIYLRAIMEEVKRGKQAILLVPEIALTPQMIGYFERSFGPHLALFHSKLSEGQRLHEWMKAKTGYAPLVIGSRSAIFAPVKNPGIIILDEEHEWTYKQESAPYYETHRVAEMIREQTGCRLVFGSATPRLESYHKARLGQYSHFVLSERFNQSALPDIAVVDLREEFKRRNFSIFSYALSEAIREALQKKEQIILFVNQRGMARAILCRDCGKTLQCPRCEVSLTLHGGSYGSPQHLLCHYCSYKTPSVLKCPHCHSVNIRHAGVGTERVEEELFRVFPQARVVRADKDTTSDKFGFSPIYEAFKKGDYDILVGTQMVAKGLDFPRVSLIGLVLADIGLHIPDFRSHERLFQLITQVSGRAGRGEATGKVILQTYQPDHPAIRMAAGYAYNDFAEAELAYRKKLGYPPYSQLVKFTVTGSDSEKLSRHVETEVGLLEDIFKVNGMSGRVIAAPAMIPRIGGTYYYNVLLKGIDPEEVFVKWKVPKGWRIDIDPIHTI